MHCTTGVAMTTYNGAEYLLRQLDSIRLQCCMPDRVVICDDGSGDESCTLVEAYIEKHGLEQSWRLVRNQQNLGYTRNFFQAIDMLDTELIFFSDQDDVWNPEKIARMRVVMEERPEICLLSCGYRFVDENDAPIETLRYGKFGNTGALRKIEAGEIVREFNWPGMCMAVRRDFWREKCRMHENSGVPFDRLFALMAEKEGGFWQLDWIGADHRIHSNNAGGEKVAAKDYLSRANKLRELYDACAWHEAALKLPVSEVARRAEEGYLALIQLRREALKRRNPLLSMRAFLCQPVRANLRGILADICMILFSKT